MSGILFLAHRVPYPPDRGDKIRSFHVLKALAELAPVHAGCFAETASDMQHASRVAELAKTHCMPRRAKPLVLAGLEALIGREPVSLAAFRNRQLAAWVNATLAREDIDTIYLFSGQMGQYVPRGWRGRVVVDLVDVDSAKLEAYSRQASGLRQWLHAREGRLLAQEEARLARRAERTLLVSEAEAVLLRARVPSSVCVEALGNGIDAACFDPQATVPHPALAGDGPHIVFTGQMDYPPNIAAALRAIDRLMPGIRKVHPTATFHVVGRAPVSQLRARDGTAGVRVWGEVPDVRPFLAGATLVIAPLEIARGVQNKVLEAMAMVCPIVLTTGAATGIPARDGQHFAVADSDENLIARALALLGDKTAAKAMGRAARAFVAERMSWPAMLARLPEIVGRPVTEKRDAA